MEPLRYLSRPTGGVKLVSLDKGASVVAVAHNGEAAADIAADEVEAGATGVVESGTMEDPGGGQDAEGTRDDAVQTEDEEGPA